MNDLDSEEGRFDSPGILTACIHSWILTIARGWALLLCGRSSSFVGGRLHFLGGGGGNVVVGGRWRSWAVTKGCSGEEGGWRR